MRPTSYVAAARRIAELAERVRARADATTPRERAARTRAINVLLDNARRLQRRNAANVGQRGGACHADAIA